MTKIHIALCGYARSGKDEVARILTEQHGYERIATGDQIKAELADLIERHFNFSVFTERDCDKNKIRPILEAWGEARRTDHLSRVLQIVCVGTAPYVNTRVMRVAECRAWKQATGGFVVRVSRQQFEAVTDFESRCMSDLVEAQVIDAEILNHGTLEDLKTQVIYTCFALAARVRAARAQA